MNDENMLKVAKAIRESASTEYVSRGSRFPGRMMFNMSTFNHRIDSPEQALELGLPGCGTMACIAGWASFIYQEETIEKIKNGTATQEERDLFRFIGIESSGGQYLDLTADERASLFYPEEGSIWARQAERFGWNTNDNGSIASWSSITADQAATVLEEIVSGKLQLEEIR